MSFNNKLIFGKSYKLNKSEINLNQIENKRANNVNLKINRREYEQMKNKSLDYKNNYLRLNKLKKVFSVKDKFNNINYYYDKIEKKNWTKNWKFKDEKIFNFLPFSNTKSYLPNQLIYNNIKNNLTIQNIVKKNKKKKIKISTIGKDNLKNFMVFSKSNKQKYMNRWILKKNLKKDIYVKNPTINIDFSMFLKNNTLTLNIMLSKSLKTNKINPDITFFNFNFLKQFNKNLIIKIVDIIELKYINILIKNHQIFINKKEYKVADIRDILYSLNIKLVGYSLIISKDKEIWDNRFLNLKSPYLYDEKKIIYYIKKFINKYNCNNNSYMLELNHKIKKYINK